MVRKKKQTSPRAAQSSPPPARSGKARSRVHGAPVTAPILPARWAWILLALVIVSTGLIRARLLDFPLERAEGEFASVGQLMLHGVPPYRHARNMKLPGTSASYATVRAL